MQSYSQHYIQYDNYISSITARLTKICVPVKRVDVCNFILTNIQYETNIFSTINVRARNSTKSVQKQHDKSSFQKIKLVKFKQYKHHFFKRRRKHWATITYCVKTIQNMLSNHFMYHLTCIYNIFFPTKDIQLDTEHHVATPLSIIIRLTKIRIFLERVGIVCMQFYPYQYIQYDKNEMLKLANINVLRQKSILPK